MSDNTAVQLSISNHIADVCFGNPEKRNALGEGFWPDLIGVFEEIDQSSDVRVVILRSEGKVFSAGIDVKFLEKLIHFPDLDQARAMEKFRRNIMGLQHTINLVENCRLPVIALVQGGCLGAGMDLVAACDIIYATKEAYFTIQEVNIGVAADLGSLQRLPRRLPYGLLRELAFTGRPLPAEEALSCGFVTSVHEDYDAALSHAQQNAAEIAAKSPLAILGTKQAFLFDQGDMIGKGLDYIATWNAGLFSTVDTKNSIEAVMQKKKPKYTGLHD